MTTKTKFAVYAAIPSLVVVGLLVLVWRGTHEGPVERGKNLNMEAWAQSYLERDLPVPQPGPRDGVWGERLRPKARHGLLGWHEPEISIPGILDVDQQGVQTYRSHEEPSKTVLILGGSVAFGSYASTISQTYFHVMGKALDRSGSPCDIHVVAAGAWKSAQEVRALLLHFRRVEPDLVLFLNGLNDLTSGATSRALYRERTTPSDGSEWTPSYHEHDYEQRVTDYLENMKSAAGIITAAGSQMLVALQPSLVERKQPTRIERELLEASLKPHASADALAESYDAMRRGLEQLARSPNVYFADCSRVFGEERETTLVDLWHFGDAGQRILGAALAQEVSRILGSGMHAGGSPSRRATTELTTQQIGLEDRPGYADRALP